MNRTSGQTVPLHMPPKRRSKGSATVLTLTRVPRTSLVDEVIASMRTMLSEKAWAVGSKLPSEQQLSEQLGVGRSTVREALRVLGHLGLVESRSGSGTFVVDRGMPQGRVEFPRTEEALRELFEFRRAIEVPAARLAAERRSKQELRDIETAWRTCAAAVDGGSAFEFARLDYNFHFKIVSASRNRFYIGAYETLEAAFVNYVSLVLGLGPLSSMLGFHDGLIAAIKLKDAKAAERAAEENFRETDVRLELFHD